MGKIITIHKRAEQELHKFPNEVEEGFRGHIGILREAGLLSFPEARKISQDLFEIRVSHEGSYRGFYAYINHKSIALLHFFQKKTSKTPIRNIKTALQRLKKYK